MNPNYISSKDAHLIKEFKLIIQKLIVENTEHQRYI